MPLSKGGSNRAENLVIACRPCNRLKADMTYEAFLEIGPPKLTIDEIIAEKFIPQGAD